MKLKSIAITGMLLTSATISSTVNAQETALEGLLSMMIKQAVAATTTEVKNNVLQSIAQTSYMFQLDSDVLPVRGKVSVTELAKAERKEDEKEAAQ